MAYGAGRFVAIGKRETWSTTEWSSTWKPLADTTVAVWSDDGATWQPVTLPQRRGWLRDVAYGNGVFLALGGIGDWLNDVTFAAGSFVAVGTTGILTSADGRSWTSTAIPLPD